MNNFNHKHYDYKWTKGFGLAILLALFLLIGSAYAQIVSGSVNTPSGYSIDSTTGNLIPYDSSLKTNTGVSSSLGGFSGSFDPTDGYTFSYVNETIGWAGVNLGGFAHGYQNTNAVFVTGFMYGLKYRFPCANSIGGSCDNTAGPQDTLQVEIGYYPASGSPDFRIHQLGLKNQTDGNSAYNLNWQQLAETYTFAGAKTLTQAGAVNMSIIGQDAGFWACLMPDCYGPQVKDAYIRANYSVDPCILNPAFNPSCPGFNNVLQGAKSPTFYYSYNIAQSLPHIGGGVQLHGYDYGFNWFNYGACYNTFMLWCTDWRTDGGGFINFKISDKNNVTMFSDSKYVEGNNSGGSYANRYLFTESKNSLDMGSIQWWTSSVWNHFGWTGWTKPIWSPDPCYEQPLYSPNCSNFDAEIKRLADEQNTIQKKALDATVASVSSTTTTPDGTITTKIDDANTFKPTVTVTTELDPVKPPPPPPPIGPKPEVLTTTEPSSVGTTSNRTPTTRVEVSSSTEMALSLVRQNQQRENSITTQASQNAMQTAAVAATVSVKQAESIAGEAVSRSQNIMQSQEQHSNIEHIINSTRTDQPLNLGPAPGSTSVVNIDIQQRTNQSQASVDYFSQSQNNNTSTSTTAIVQFNAMSATSAQQTNIIVTSPVVQNNVVSTPLFNPIQPLTTNQTLSTQASTYTPPIQQEKEIKITESIQQQNIITNAGAIQIPVLQTPQQLAIEITQPVLQTAAIAPVVSIDIPQTQANFTTDKTNPINEIIENKSLQIEQDRKETTTQVTKQSVQDNDAAVGVNIDTLAKTPVGFNSYMIALTDANFYTPKEIYRNQKTVDNVRALRTLASDRLHQQMVDQQYLPR